MIETSWLVGTAQPVPRDDFVAWPATADTLQTVAHAGNVALLQGYYNGTLCHIDALRSAPVQAAQKGAKKPQDDLADPTTGMIVSRLAYVLRYNFDRWDRNRDGRLSAAEIANALADPTLSKLDRAALEVLRKCFDELTSLQKDGEGFSRADLAELIKRSHADPVFAGRFDRQLYNREHGTPQARVEDSLATGQPVRVTNKNGRTATVVVRKIGAEGDKILYVVTVGRHTLKVRIPPDKNAVELIATIVECFLDVPEHLRGELKEINVHNEAHPKEPTGKTWAATAGNGVIDFWHGSKYVHDTIFHHEYGHLVGQRAHADKHTTLGRRIDYLLGFTVFTPQEWEAAAKADGRSISDYGDTSPTEDFAEAWSQYMYARQMGGIIWDGFRKSFPNRVRLLDLLYQDRYK